MKKNRIKKALFVALASAMIFGQVQTVMAAENMQQTSDAVVAETEVTPSITEFSIGDSAETNSESIQINLNGYGASAKLYVNDVLYTSTTGSYYGGDWSIYSNFSGTAGVSYKFKLVVENSDGTKKVEKSVTRKFKSPAFGLSDGNISISTSSSDTGYKKPTGVYLYVYLNESINSKVHYKILRRTAGTGYKEIYSGSSYYTYGIYYTDTSVRLGTTYYYKVQLVTGTDSYNKTSKVIATSPAYKIAYNSGSVDFSVSRVGGGVQIDLSDVGANNQFDIYRSTKSVGGYKKIKTIYNLQYVDRSVKAGQVYYYKIVPKYYDSTSGKTYAGVKTDAKGVRMLMGTTDLEVVQISSTSVKLTWDKTAGANIYEVWSKRGDISGDKYRKLVTTKGTTVTVKGLASDGYYDFILKSQSKSGGKVICENTSYDGIHMGYRDYVMNLRATARRSAMSSDKKTIAIYTRLTWDRDWGASGYIITAYNRYTGKMERVAKLASPAKNVYTFKNLGTVSKGIKYEYVYVAPYKGRAIGQTLNTIYVNALPYGSNVKTVRKSNSEVKVTWTAVPGASDYNIHRHTQLEDYGNGIGSSTTNSYVDRNLSTKTTYTYYVVAYSNIPGVQSSYYVDLSDAKTFISSYVHKIGTPKIGKAVNSAASTIDVTWNAVAGAKTYGVYRSTSKTGKYTMVATTKGTKYSDKKVAKGKTYYYKVTAVTMSDNGIKSQSSYSAVVGAKCAK